MAKQVPLFQVDAFASRPFSGNPAAVCLLRQATDSGDAEAEKGDDGSFAGASWELSSEVMMKIAAENNLSETAFVRPLPSIASDVDARTAFASSSDFFLRWFTPTIEVNLCGHATMATAAAIFFECGNESEILSFHTKSGVLKARRCAGSNSQEIEMVLPLNPPLSVCKRSSDLHTPRASVYLKIVQAALSVPESPRGKTSSRMETWLELQYSANTKKLVVMLDPEKTDRGFLESLSPDPSEFMAIDQSPLGDDRITGVIVTLADEAVQQYDFLSRYFAPWNGIDEDPVTGSAHTVLSAFWSHKLGKNEMRARQCSPRGGDLGLRVDFAEKRLYIRGSSCVVIAGSLRL